MILLGLYGNATLYDALNSVEEDVCLEKVDQLIDVEQLARFPVLLVDLSALVGEDIMIISKRLSKLPLTKVIYLKKEYKLAEVKQLMFNDAYDCIKQDLPPLEIIMTIQDAFALYEREMKEKEKLEKYTITSVRESLAYDLLHGNIKSAKEIWERVRLAKLTLIPNMVLTLSIDHFSELVRNKGDAWKNSLRQEVIQAIDQYKLDFETVKIPVNQGNYAVLLSLPVQADESKYKTLAFDYAERIQEIVEDHTDYTITIGIGSYYEDARNLHLSFQESEQSLNYHFFSTNYSITYIEDVNYYDRPQYEAFKSKIQEMVNKFSIGDIAAVYQVWETIYVTVTKNRSFHPDEVRLQVLDLLFSLSKSSIQNGANSKKVLPLQIKYARDLDQLTSLAEIDAWMKNIIQQLSNLVSENHNEQVLKSVQTVLQYVERHYTEDIGLESVAEKVQLSPNYLSAIFKQTTGSSFIDYVTNLRMEKAKQSLMDLNVSIFEIAESIGYNSSQYFSRVFKNNVGITPSAYRNKVIATKK